MISRVSMLWILFGCAASTFGAEQPKSGEPKAAASKAETEKPAAPDFKQEIAQTMQAVAEAFNKHDVAAFAAHWTENAVHVDRETGDRAEGRAQVTKDLDATFKARPGIRMAIDVVHARLSRPDVATLEGTVTIADVDTDPVVTDLSATLIKVDGKWRLDSAYESAVAKPATAYDALKGLEWMVGKWIDEDSDSTIETNVRWTANQSFLVRAYSVVTSEGIEREGSQVIGWDPRQGRIRSWTFDSDGSFGESTWTKDGDTWLVRTSITTSDGGTKSATQVLTPEGDDAIVQETIGLEVNGEPQPAREPVKFVRAAEDAAAAPADADQDHSESKPKEEGK